MKNIARRQQQQTLRILLDHLLSSTTFTHLPMQQQQQLKQKATPSLPVDMSATIGGRVVRPALPVVDPSGPTPVEVTFNNSLQAFASEHIPLEGREGIERRERVLDRMGSLCREWIMSVARSMGLPKDVVDNAGGKLFTSGSYRLGVHEPGADIDAILVAPALCHRSDFFGRVGPQHASSNEGDDDAHPSRNQRDPNSLAERIRRHPDVTNFVAVESAAVPILTFDWESINIDLLFARINSNSVGDFDIDNDASLSGADSATEKSLNGPRVTNLIAALVSGTPQRYQIFLQVVRCVRKWAKARGLYSNKSGYWGGVNINIGVALVVQLYPNACAASLLRKFFLVFKTWRWPQPVLLTKPHDAGYGLPVWNPQSARGQVAPMITPAYPAMNSTLSISRQTLQILQGEFERAHAVVDKLWKQHNREPGAALDWSVLFEPSDFFIAYPHYLSLCIVGPTQSDAQTWAGFVESRLRKLVSDMLGRSLPLKKIQLWPKKFEVCVADPGAILTLAQRQNSVTYFIGFQIDKKRMRGDQLNVELPLQAFRQELSRFHPLVPGMDLLVKNFRVKELPRFCFESYKGGKEEAMKKRRQIRNDDPERQEKRRLARLEELKAKMAEIQRKKEEDQERKRKLEEVELEDDYQVALEDEQEEDEPVDQEESNLLESALDTIPADDVGETKTREEAEADRRKLLAGEMLEEAGETDVVESDDEDYGYTADRGRHSIVKRPNQVDEGHRDMRSLPVPEADLEILKKLGYAVVSEDECKILGADLLPPWRAAGSDPPDPTRPPIRMKIKFLEKFDVVPLDAMGHVIDLGDEDFTPSKSWQGSRVGFEFKVGERGLGYYRTGKKVVVPSNVAY